MAMDTGGGQPPPGGGNISAGGPVRSYSEKLRTNVNYNQRLKRNLLEISLERTEKDADLNVGIDCMERVMTSVGIDPALPVGFLTKYRGNFIIMSVWFEPSVNLDRFCKDEKIKVSKGVSTGYIRPAGRPEVVVTLTGLDFNTPDQFVIEYLSKFGSVVNKQPIYCKGTEGFMKNKYNGVRKYQVDFSKSTRQMGSYHFLDGEVVRINYRGNTETCGRCHQVAKDCPGGGKKKECKEQEGKYLHISDHMRELWKVINFVPTGFELPTVEGGDNGDNSGEIPILDGLTFERKIERPLPDEKDKQKYDGITISNFPPKLSDADILTFLFEKGLSKDINKNTVQLVRSDKNTKVVIHDSLDWKTVQALMENIHFHESKQKFWNFPLYCKPLRSLTPVKTEAGDHDHDQVQGVQGGAGHVVQEKPESENLSTKPKVKPTENKNTIPGMPEADFKKAEEKRKRKLKEQKKNQAVDSADDFDFDDVDAVRTPAKAMSFTDIQLVFDKTKRKDVSPAESAKNKKQKSQSVNQY